MCQSASKLLENKSPCLLTPVAKRGSHHGQVAQVLADLAASLGRLQRQPFPAGLLAPLPRAQAAVVGAVAGRGQQAGVVELLSLAHLYVPIGQESMLQ